MALRDQITDEGWYDLIQAPTFLEIAMAGVSRQGPLGGAEERTALKMSFDDLIRDTATPPTGLLGEIAADIKVLLSKETSKEDRESALKPIEARYAGQTPHEIAMGTVARVTSATAALSPDDTLGYREWLYLVVSDIAESAREGGLFRHGPATSEAEAALLHEVAAGLGVPVES